MRATFRRPTIHVTPSSYKPTFKQSTQRAWYQRLTPLSWLLTGVSGLMLAGMLSVGITKINEAHNGTQTLSDYLGTSSRPVVASAPAGQDVAPAKASQASPVVAKPAQSTQMVQSDAQAPQAPALPTAVPTALPVVAQARAVVPAVNAATHVAPGASALETRADGTLGAPPEVLQQATADVQAWFQATRTLDAKRYLQTHDTLLAQYLTGSALENVQQQDASKQQFSINRAGKLSVEVKSFSVDGFTAKAGVVMHGWVNDIYTTKTGKLAKKNVAQVDQLTIMTIRYDEASQHWKISSIDDVAPLK